MGRLRRASAKSRRRPGALERFVDDEDAHLGVEAELDRGGDTAASLLAKFNRLVRDPEAAGASGEPGEVAGFDGAAVVVRFPDGRESACQIRSALTKMFSGVTAPLAVGDRVAVERTPEGDTVICGVAERSNQLARADSHNKALVHVFAANVDRLVIVTSTIHPELKTGLVDRYLLIAHYNDITPLIVINKTDLADAGDVPELYRGLGYEVFTTCAAAPERSPESLAQLRSALGGLRCVFTGHSGVGKSSLINALYPEIGARVGAVSQAVSKGRHTTTSARSYPLSGGGRLIDTPGIRECGITGMTPLDVALLYPDIAFHHAECRFHNCTHLHEPDCAVQAAVERGAIDLRRYDSYLSIIGEDLAGR